MRRFHRPSSEQVASIERAGGHWPGAVLRYLAQHSLEAVIEDAVNEAVLRACCGPLLGLAPHAYRARDSRGLRARYYPAPKFWVKRHEKHLTPRF